MKAGPRTGDFASDHPTTSERQPQNEGPSAAVRPEGVSSVRRTVAGTFANRAKRISLVPLMFTILMSLTAPYMWWLVTSLRGHERLEDFSVYYLSALELRTHVDPYTTNFKPLAHSLGMETQSMVRATHPPTFLLLFEPFTHLPLSTGYWIWTILNFSALTASLILMLKWQSRLSIGTAVALLAGTLWYAPILLHFWFAQSDLLVLLMLVLMMHLAERRHDGAAAGLLAFAALMRVFPLVVGGDFLFARRWRLLVYSAIAVILGLIATVAIAGVGNCLSFAAGISYLNTRVFIATARNIAPSAFVSRVFWYFCGSSLSQSANAVRIVLVVCIDIAILMLNFHATALTSDEKDSDGRLFGLWIVTSLMLSPTVWIHYEVLLLLPFVQLTNAYVAGRASYRAVATAAVSIILSQLTLAAYLLAQHSVLEELGFGSLLFAYISCYWFATDRDTSRPHLATAVNCMERSRLGRDEPPLREGLDLESGQQSEIRTAKAELS